MTINIQRITDFDDSLNVIQSLYSTNLHGQLVSVNYIYKTGWTNGT